MGSFAERCHAIQRAIDAGLTDEEIREQGIGQRLWPAEYDEIAAEWDRVRCLRCGREIRPWTVHNGPDCEELPYA